MKRITNKRLRKKPWWLWGMLGILGLIIGGIIATLVMRDKTDVYKGTNILDGAWQYNDDGGKYIFKENKRYIQYTNKDTSDNYCLGTYEYKYGAKSDKGMTIRQDENYYYYTLTLKEEKCVIMGKEFVDDYEKRVVFGLEKENENVITITNTENENIFKMWKVKE